MQDELKGLRGSLEFRKGDGNDYEGGHGGGRKRGGEGGGDEGDSEDFDLEDKDVDLLEGNPHCLDCCGYAGEDQVLLGLGYCNRQACQKAIDDGLCSE